MVRGVHDAGDWKFGQGWDTYVLLPLLLPFLPRSPLHPAFALARPALCTAHARFADVCMAEIGFVAFDQYKRLLADADGKVTGPRAALAGFAAGVTESLLAVTPTESIKTQL